MRPTPRRSPPALKARGDAAEPTQRHDYDWIVIGSGFGGSVAALRLAEKGYRVAVLEQGRRFADGDFANSAWQLRRFLWAPRLGLRGIMKVTMFKHLTLLSGVGVGGGSLVYGNTLYQPRSDAFYRHPQWADLADWRSELAPHFTEADRMLGAVDYTGEGPSERLMRQLADDLGVPDSYRPTRVGVYFGEPGLTVPDPFFGGQGPARTGCVRCGQCLLGCRHGAKNTLVKNYLWKAEALGAEIHSDCRVVDVAPAGNADGSDGYAITSERPGAWLRSRRRRLTAAGVVCAAGPLGTNLLLRECKDRGSLPRISAQLGALIRTNSEAITAATARTGDYRSDIAITASIYPDDQTHITNNTYGAAGDAMALMFGPLVDTSRPRLRAAAYLAALIRSPRTWLNPKRIRGWSRRSVIFTTMQSSEGAMRLTPAPFRSTLRTKADRKTALNAHIPVASAVTRLAARRVDGQAQDAVTASVRNAPTTAHLLGGAVIGRDPEHAVIDRDHHVFGYRNLLVCDGSAIPANVGVNPSLTITALAERAMQKIPAAHANDS